MCYDVLVRIAFLSEKGERLGHTYSTVLGLWHGCGLLCILSSFILMGCCFVCC